MTIREELQLTDSPEEYIESSFVGTPRVGAADLRVDFQDTKVQEEEDYQKGDDPTADEFIKGD